MSEVLSANVNVTAEVPPGPLDANNAVLGYLEYPDASWNRLPEDLPRETDVRLRRLYGAEVEDATIGEELLGRAIKDIMEMKDAAARLNVRMWLAGFEVRVMPTIAPGYQNSLRTLRAGIQRRAITSGEETVEHSKGATNTVRHGSTPAEIVPPVKTVPVNLIKAITVSSRTIRQPEAVALKATTQPSSQAKPGVGNSKPIENRRRYAELKLSPAQHNMQQLARALMERHIDPEQTVAFKEFMIDFGLPLYRGVRERKGKKLDTVDRRVQEIFLAMEGLSTNEVQKQLGGDRQTPLTTLYKSFAATIHKACTANQMGMAFVEYLAGQSLPEVNAMLGDIPRRAVGKVALAERSPRKPRNVTPSRPVSSTAHTRPAPTIARRVVISYSSSDDTEKVPYTSGDQLPGHFEPDEELEWQFKANCAQTDPETFFPEKGGSTREAKKICTGCEVRGECLGYALEHEERFGIWGGLSERERRRLKRRPLSTIPPVIEADERDHESERISA